ncbi:glycoside hydrolase family 88 protein [Hymenobacter sp. GOD-10R]|uniref:glycoside hydrolase family 88/105 protein n=1 Tax=Hymenobacter sp. GOD-10R TaxID=3093922 RepID=UPI002D78A839|nr:glycoside hydrolase family 88 protein [Hymenobacter sp. GOD-10R]WRQ30324.1 glycoside hydrolase family 88 protein [Hymenobacter sp. GOD-10R]
MTNPLRFLLLGLMLLSQASWAQTKSKVAGAAKPLSQRMADSFMAEYPDSLGIAKSKAARWGYEQGVMLTALERVGQRTNDPRYFNYVHKIVDYSVQPDGTITGYKSDDYSVDNIPTGRSVLTLAQRFPKETKYRKAADLLRQQLTTHPRTKEGGFWHKKRYPNQMWLDGLYMLEPFYAEYSKIYNEPANFDDIAKQFALIEKYCVDPKTGLLYHAYDESKEQKWANKQTGQSPNFWSRGMGWYAMALVDVLDYFPKSHPQRAQLIKDLQRLAPVLTKYQDPKTGGWYQVTDQGTRAGNYIETSSSSMFVYALAKGTRLGYLDKAFQKVAQQGYDGLVKNFIETTPNGALAMNGTVSVGGLGGDPYRDGSYEYYLSEKIKQNDFKGVGPFIMASLEIEAAKKGL